MAERGAPNCDAQWLTTKKGHQFFEGQKSFLGCRQYTLPPGADTPVYATACIHTFNQSFILTFKQLHIRCTIAHAYIFHEYLMVTANLVTSYPNSIIVTGQC